MQVHRRWLTLAALVTVALRSSFVDAQVFTMQSLDGDPTSLPDLDAEPSPDVAPSPTARPRRPPTDPPSDAPVPPKTPKPPREAPDSANLPRAIPPSVNPKPKTDNGGVAGSNSGSNAGPVEEPAVDDRGQDPPVEEEPKTAAPPPPRKKPKEIVFTNSPFLEQATPVPNSVLTAEEGDETGLGDGDASPSETTPPPKPKRPHGRPKKRPTESASDSNAGSSANSQALETTAEDVESTTQDSEKQSSDLTAGLPNGDKPALESGTTTSQSGSASEYGSATSVLTDAAMAEQSAMSSTLLLGLMMGGAVALVLIVAVFVYMKTSSATEEEDDMARVLRAGPNDDHKTVAQVSTIAASYHQNHNMSPMTYHEDKYQVNPSSQYDQEPFGHPGHMSVGRFTYNDPNLDMLTPRSQIALAHSQLSLPPMAESRYSHGSSQYSEYSNQSSFYDQSGYSAASHVGGAYPGMHNGKDGHDPVDSLDEESDFEGDSIQDMSNVWNSAGRKNGRSMDESQYEPADSRSTSASDYKGKNRFQESEYSEYRPSTGYKDSFAPTNSDYDKSGYDKSGYDKSGYDQSGYDKSGYDMSGYDKSFAGGNSFQSSGFSDFDQSVAHSKSKNSDSSSFYRGDASRFTDKSFY